MRSDDNIIIPLYNHCNPLNIFINYQFTRVIMKKLHVFTNKLKYIDPFICLHIYKIKVVIQSCKVLSYIDIVYHVTYPVYWNYYTKLFIRIYANILFSLSKSEFYDFQ